MRFPKSSSLQEVIRHRYGNDTVKLVRKMEKLDYKHRKCLLDLDFLMDCQRHNVVPNFLFFKLANRRLQTSEEYRSCQRLLLNSEIDEKRRNIRRLEKDILLNKSILLSRLNWIDFNHVSHINITHNDKLIKKQSDIQKKKLHNILSYSPHASDGHTATHDPDKVVFNFSSLDLCDATKTLLARGLDYALPEHNIQYEDYMLPYELLYRGVKNFAKSPEDAINLHARLKNVAVTSFSRFKQNNRHENNLTNEELNALNSLMKNNNIVIQKSDKGNTVVLCDKAAYIERMKELIEDDTKFTHLNKPPDEWLSYILSSEKRVRQALYKYCESNKKHVKYVFTEQQYWSIAPTGTKPGILYGLPKIHKALVNNLPKFRPIISMIATPTYKLSKFLVPIIEPITTNEYTVKDSFSFAQEVVDFDSNLFMSSLDVTSLFTNIPLNETTDIICDELFKDKELICGMDKTVFRELLVLAMEETCFVFDGKLYKQCDGVSMGSSLGPHYANSFLCKHERKWIEDCPDNIKPLKYRRYVDDIFILCRDKEHHSQFLKYMNSKHENISFTEETESNNTMPFLDVLITRSNGSFVTSLYRKATFSGVFTNFYSFISIQFKASLISTLLYRCFHLTSSNELFHQEVERLREILAKNSYPLEFIDQCITSFLNKQYKPKPTVATVEPKTTTIMLPFLGKVSLEIRNRLRKYTKKYVQNCCKLQVIFRSQRRLKRLFSFKDKLPTSLQSYIIYLYKCRACNSSYIGKTDRHQTVRWCEHLKLTPITRQQSKSKTKPTAIQEHITSTQHQGSLEDFEVIGRESSRNDFFLRVKESLLIKRHKPKLNENEASTPLCLF